MKLEELMSPRKRLFTEETIMEDRIVALDAGTGKQLFDTNVNKREYIRKFMDYEVCSIWAGLKTAEHGFGVWCQPVVMMYLAKGSAENE